MNGLETRWLGVVGGIVAGALILPAAASAAVIYDQTDHATPPVINSTDPNFAPSNYFAVNNNDRTADDFTVPSGQIWSVNEIDVTGAYSSPGTPDPHVSVYVYADAAGQPGSAVITREGVAATGGPNYAIPLVDAPPLTAGTYWVTVQQSPANPVYWSWGTRSVQTGNPARWIDNGTNSPNVNCPLAVWNPRTICWPGNSLDQTFELKGTSQDIQDPETTITQSPKKLKTKKRKATVSISFESSEAGSSFSCSLDGAAPKPCTSPFTAKVGKGKHDFTVAATDASGNVDRTPAQTSFAVKRKHKHKH